MSSSEKHNFLETQWLALCASQVDFIGLNEAATEFGRAQQAAATAEVRFSAAIKKLNTHFETPLCAFLSPLGDSFDAMAQAHAEHANMLQTQFCEKVLKSIKPTETKKLNKDMKKIKSLSGKKHESVEKAHSAWKKQKKLKQSEKKKKKYDDLFLATESWLDKEINKVKYNNELRFQNLGQALIAFMHSHQKLLSSCNTSYNGLPPMSLDDKDAIIAMTFKGDSGPPTPATAPTDSPHLPSATATTHVEDDSDTADDSEAPPPPMDGALYPPPMGDDAPPSLYPPPMGDDAPPPLSPMDDDAPPPPPMDG